MAFPKWDSLRGRAKWHVKGIAGNLSNLPYDRLLPLSDLEREILKEASTRLDEVMNSWDETTLEEREIYATRHPKGS